MRFNCFTHMCEEYSNYLGLLPYLSKNDKAIMAGAITEVPIAQFLFKIATSSHGV